MDALLPTMSTFGKSVPSTNVNELETTVSGARKTPRI